MPKIPFYTQNYKYAEENGEIEFYRSSRKANIDCATAINKALSDNYADNKFNSRAAFESISKDFDIERITAIIASQIYRSSYDKRYDDVSRTWATQICQTEARFPLQITEDIHMSSNPGIINIFAKTVIENEKVMQNQIKNVNTEERKMNITAKVTPLDREDNLKALASIAVNGSFVINSIRIFNGENGLFVKMPQGKDYNGETRDIVFPITKEARELINNTVIEQYAIVGKLSAMSEAEKETFATEYELATELGKPASEQEKALYKAIKADNEVVAAEKTALSVTLREVNGEHTKAKGQVVLDESIVITDIRVIDGGKGKFVAMPSYQDQFGEYNDIAYPVTKEARERLENAVLSKFNSLSAERKGVKISDLGEKENISYHSLNNKFAEKVMSELDNQGVKYAAKITDKTSIAINKDNTEKFKAAVEKSKPVKEKNETPEINSETPSPPKKHSAR